MSEEAQRELLDLGTHRCVPRHAADPWSRRAPPRLHAHDLLVQHDRPGFRWRRAADSMKTNTIPDCVDIGVDVRTLPGETAADVDAHLRAALGDLYDKVEVEVVMNDPASISRANTPLWDALARSIAKPFPTARPDARAGRRLHRFADLPADGCDLVRRRLVQPGRRPFRLRSPLPRQRRARRRRESAADHKPVARRNPRPPRLADSSQTGIRSAMPVGNTPLDGERLERGCVFVHSEDERSAQNWRGIEDIPHRVGEHALLSVVVGSAEQIQESLDGVESSMCFSS